MDFQSSEIPGREHHDILALNIDGFCLAVGSREACLALLEINDESEGESFAPRHTLRPYCDIKSDRATSSRLA